MVRVGCGVRVRIMGLARISAVFASSFMVWTFIMVVSGVVFGGSLASIIMSLYGAMIFSSGGGACVVGLVCS